MIPIICLYIHAKNEREHTHEPYFYEHFKTIEETLHIVDKSTHSELKVKTKSLPFFFIFTNFSYQKICHL